MPAFYRLTGEMVLVRSNKGDAYYVVTPKTCSCPSATYHPGQACKHQRKYFPVAKPAKEELTSIRPEAKWPGNVNGPINMPDSKMVA